jgi:hypothetical protein
MTKEKRTLWLHIGAPKTGTTYLQEVLYANRATLAQQGFLYPMEGPCEHIEVSRDFRFEPYWIDGEVAPWACSWKRLIERCVASPLTNFVVSEELFAGTHEDHIAMRFEELKRIAPDLQVKVIYTARDLARQIPSDWQEQIKHGHVVTLEQFTDDLVAMGIDTPWPFGHMFWGHHDPNYVLPKWEKHVGAENIHIITVPQAGSDSPLLSRFCDVIGLDPAAIDVSRPDSNTSMGLVETEMLRRLNEHHHLEERLGYSYDGKVRLTLVHGMMAGWKGKERIVLPSRHFRWFQDRSRLLIAELAARGYAVTGDLNELVPTRPTNGRVCAEVTDSDLREVSMRAMAGLLERLP